MPPTPGAGGQFANLHLSSLPVHTPQTLNAAAHYKEQIENEMMKYKKMQAVIASLMLIVTHTETVKP